MDLTLLNQYLFKYLRKGIINTDVFVLITFFYRQSPIKIGLEMLTDKVGILGDTLYLYLKFLEFAGLLFINTKTKPHTYKLNVVESAWKKLCIPNIAIVNAFTNITQDRITPTGRKSYSINDILLKYIIERLPADQRVFNVKNGQIKILHQVAESLDIALLLKWFLKEKLGKQINGFNLGIFLHSRMINEYRKSRVAIGKLNVDAESFKDHHNLILGDVDSSEESFEESLGESSGKTKGSKDGSKDEGEFDDVYSG